MIDACIFDLDGVIVDTAKFHFIAWNRLASTIGFSLSQDLNEQLKGVSRKESLDAILRWAGIEMPEAEKHQLMALKNEWYLELISDMDQSEMLPGARDLLENLHSQQIKIALGSASKNARTILQSMDIIHYFDVIIDGTKTTRSKPDPQVFLMGAEQLNVSPERCIVFEDSISGIQAANQGGFFSIGIGSQDQLHAADHVLPGLTGIKYQHLIEIMNEKVH